MLQPISVDISRADDELDAFKAWFQQRQWFTEREVVSELKKYGNLCALIGFLGNRPAIPDLQKLEFEIQGIFRSDYVVGNSATRHFVLVEFEGGEEHSIFGPGQTNQMRNWGVQIQHGFSQIADWSWAKNDNQHTTTYKNAFGMDNITETYALICGREASLNNAERSRLTWRSDKTLISGSKVLFMTFDDLVVHFDSILDLVRRR